MPKPTEDWATVKAREWLTEQEIKRGIKSVRSLAALLREVATEAYQEGRRDESEDRL